MEDKDIRKKETTETLRGKSETLEGKPVAQLGCSGPLWACCQLDVQPAHSSPEQQCRRLPQALSAPSQTLQQR